MAGLDLVVEVGNKGLAVCCTAVVGAAFGVEGVAEGWWKHTGAAGAGATHPGTLHPGGSDEESGQRAGEETHPALAKTAGAWNAAALERASMGASGGDCCDTRRGPSKPRGFEGSSSRPAISEVRAAVAGDPLGDLLCDAAGGVAAVEVGLGYLGSLPTVVPLSTDGEECRRSAMAAAAGAAGGAGVRRGKGVGLVANSGFAGGCALGGDCCGARLGPSEPRPGQPSPRSTVEVMSKGPP